MRIEEVKKILDEMLAKYPVPDYPCRESINERYAKEICQLFKSEDNPDGMNTCTILKSKVQALKEGVK